MLCFKVLHNKNSEDCELNIYWKGFVAKEEQILMCLCLSSTQMKIKMGLANMTVSLDDADIVEKVQVFCANASCFMLVEGNATNQSNNKNKHDLHISFKKESMCIHQVCCICTLGNQFDVVNTVNQLYYLSVTTQFMSKNLSSLVKVNYELYEVH
jgi:hypothetical protein